METVEAIGGIFSPRGCGGRDRVGEPENLVASSNPAGIAARGSRKKLGRQVQWWRDGVGTGFPGDRCLKGKELGQELLLPSVMLKQGESIFLDDMTLDKLGNSLQVPIRVVHEAADIVAAAMGDAEETS